MTPTCSIGEALLRADKSVMGSAFGKPDCHGPLKPLMVVSEAALVGKYAHGAWRTSDSDGWVKVHDAEQFDYMVQGRSRPDLEILSPEQLRELLTVGGECEGCPDCDWRWNRQTFKGRLCHGTGREFTVCSKHWALLSGCPKCGGEGVLHEPDGRLGEDCPECVGTGDTTPKLRLTEILRMECPDCENGRCYAGRGCDGSGTIPHPALTESTEWAERLGFDREKVS